MDNVLQQVLNDQFLGKRITVPVVVRDNYGRVIPNQFTTCSGICEFIGENTFLQYSLQVTVDGMPIPVKHIKDIVLTPTPKRIRL